MFWKAFETRKEANAHLKKMLESGRNGIEVRKMDKKLFPRRKKLFHVGSFLPRWEFHGVP